MRSQVECCRTPQVSSLQRYFFQAQNDLNSINTLLHGKIATLQPSNYGIRTKRSVIRWCFCRPILPVRRERGEDVTPWERATTHACSGWRTACGRWGEVLLQKQWLMTETKEFSPDQKSLCFWNECPLKLHWRTECRKIHLPTRLSSQCLLFDCVTEIHCQIINCLWTPGTCGPWSFGINRYRWQPSAVKI